MKSTSIVVLAALAACGGEQSQQSPAADLARAADIAPADLASAPTPELGTPRDGGAVAEQTPPTESAAVLESWLATGAYRRWACEAAAHPARPGSAHARNRICSNALLSGSSGSGAYPSGAASVKELLDANDAIIGYAVGLRQGDGPGASAWFWYERVNATTYANGVAVPLCNGCHSGAPRDYIFTQVR